MFGLRLTSANSPQWAIVTPSAKKLGMWQVTFGDELGPSGDTLRRTPQAALAVALDDGLAVTSAIGEQAVAVVAEVLEYRSAMAAWTARWLAGDDDVTPPARPEWTSER